MDLYREVLTKYLKTINVNNIFATHVFVVVELV